MRKWGNSKISSLFVKFKVKAEINNPALWTLFCLVVVVVVVSLLTFERLLFFTHKKNNKMSSLGIRLRGVLFATNSAARTHAAEAMTMMRKTSQKTSSQTTTFNRRTIFTSTKTPKASSSVLSGARANRMSENAIPRGFSGRNPRRRLRRRRGTCGTL